MLAVDFGSDAKRTLRTLGRSLAIVEYSPDGTALAAKEKFCEMCGYAAAEIVGKHHRMFADRQYAESAEFREFWAKLRQGEGQERELVTPAPVRAPPRTAAKNDDEGDWKKF
jgi:methyl-accepting chemotaxis protein